MDTIRVSCENCEKKDSCKVDIGRGCRFCVPSNIDTTEGTTVKVCEGAQKLHITDWLKDYPNVETSEIVEVRFKNTRKGYYANVNNLPLCEGDIVAVEASPGHDIGIVSLTGDIVGRQMRRIGFVPMNGEFKKVYRKAKPYDIEKWQEAIALEHSTMIKSRQIAASLGLEMKIGDVEYQGDKVKAIFYYIADERVDFRELIKILAEQFRIRVEMKQIGARQEAGRIGGIGSCGRELCCASWMSSFSAVTTNAVRYQEISLNPQKLAGQCGKLKCCLTYEIDSYMDARRSFPKINAPIEIMDGNYYLIKTDIFKQLMYFSTDPNGASTTAVPVDRVRELLALNKRGIKPDVLVDVNSTGSKANEEPNFANAVGEDSITRFDNLGKRKNNKRKNQRQDKKRRDGRDAKEGREVREVHEAKEVREVKEPKEAKEATRPADNQMTAKPEKQNRQSETITSKPEQTQVAEKISASPEKQAQNEQAGNATRNNRRNNGNNRNFRNRRPGNRPFKPKEDKNESQQ